MLSLSLTCCPPSSPRGRRRHELKALVDLHAEPQGDGDGGEESAELTVDEVQVIQGALDMASKTAADAMTPIEKVGPLAAAAAAAAAAAGTCGAGCSATRRRGGLRCHCPPRSNTDGMAVSLSRVDVSLP